MSLKSKMKIICIIQARMLSSRLPGKAMLDISGKPAVGRVIDRLKKCKNFDSIYLACSDHHSDDVLYSYVSEQGINCYRGSMNNVLSRFVNISRITRAEHIVRITADCPLIDPEIVDLVIKKHLISKSEYTTNTLERTYPDGLDVEVFTKNTLRKTDQNSDNQFMQEHVTPYMHGKLKNKFSHGGFKVFNVKSKVNFADHRWTLDRKEDLRFLNKIYDNVKYDCSWKEVIEFLKKNPEIIKLNQHIKLNEGTDLDLKRIGIKK